MPQKSLLFLSLTSQLSTKSPPVFQGCGVGGITASSWRRQVRSPALQADQIRHISGHVMQFFYITATSTAAVGVQGGDGQFCDGGME